VNAATIVRAARRRSGFSLRELAARAGTSYSTLSAYERGSKVPGVDTLVRIVSAAGFALDVELANAAAPQRGDRDQRTRGEQLIEVLELADQFPSKHSTLLQFPVLAQAIAERVDGQP
jgi:transcriptional regulator with XRE-family HTH domain